jgi:hypothetical protein
MTVCISGAVSFKLRLPKIEFRFRPPYILTFSMSVPKTSVYKNDFTAAGKDHVRVARQILDMQPVPEPHPMN